MLRVVLDTNIFVSSVLSRSGHPAQVMDAWRNQEFLLLVSPAIIAELRHTLSYDRIRRKYGVTDERVDALTALLHRRAVVVDVDIDVTGSVPDDPDDDEIMACAVQGNADIVVSGDRHLLSLKSVRGISIITARTFLSELKADGAD